MQLEEPRSRSGFLFWGPLPSLSSDQALSGMRKPTIPTRECHCVPHIKKHTGQGPFAHHCIVT